MTRIAIDTLVWQMDSAYRDDPFHALRMNLGSVRPEEWDVRPARWSADEFGTLPELSICDLTVHVTGAKYMYADRAFGDASLEWADIEPPARDMAAVLAWLDEGHRALAEGLATLQDDAELATERPAPWRAPMRRRQLIEIVINHDLYHSGEINRQRALMRGRRGLGAAPIRIPIPRHRVSRRGERHKMNAARRCIIRCSPRWPASAPASWAVRATLCRLKFR